MNYKKIEEEARYQVELAQDAREKYGDNVCIPEMDQHCGDCLGAMDADNFPCIMEQADKARLRLKNLQSLDLLTKHFKSPPTAAEGNSIQGLAQTSCIYEER